MQCAHRTPEGQHCGQRVVEKVFDSSFPAAYDLLTDRGTRFLHPFGRDKLACFGIGSHNAVHLGGKALGGNTGNGIYLQHGCFDTAFCCGKHHGEACIAARTDDDVGLTLPDDLFAAYDRHLHLHNRRDVFKNRRKGLASRQPLERKSVYLISKAGYESFFEIALSPCERDGAVLLL